MKNVIKTILMILLLVTLVNSCKKNNVSPEVTQTTQSNISNPNDTIINPNDTTIVITPTVTINTHTITLSVQVKTISDNYQSGGMIPSYNGVYKIGNMLYKINNLPNVLLTGLSLNCQCNPRTQYVQGLAVGDTVRIWLNLVEAGSNSHNGLPSFDTQFNQSNGYTHYGTQYIQKKQSGEIIYIVKPY